ncbi:hypothetical protein I5F63_032935 [Pseudomonas aeruginosa]|nr:hypothetical protein [Pseudomonas aeruginosa]
MHLDVAPSRSVGIKRRFRYSTSRSIAAWIEQALQLSRLTVEEHHETLALASTLVRHGELASASSSASPKPMAFTQRAQLAALRGHTAPWAITA